MDVFNAILDFNLIYILYGLIGIGIFFMFSYVIKAVKFIKTDRIHGTVREKKLREKQLKDQINEKIPITIMNSDFRIFGLFLAFLMIAFYYRHSIKNIFETPKDSFLQSIPIIVMGILFYIFFKLKGF